ncbi:MAG: PAS domain-containing sensor histidine kinase [Bdellovibrionota bacterium]
MTDPLFFFGHSITGNISRKVNWSATSLGEPSQWPGDLKVILAMMYENRHPVCLFWGPEHIYFYNDGYIPIVGETKHPKALGSKGQEVWSEVWDLLIPQIQQVLDGEEATWNEDQHMMITGKNGMLRDAYFTYSYSPVSLSTGEIAGVLVTCSETTARVQAKDESDKKGKVIEEVLESMSDAFFSVDSNWIVTRVNNQFEKVVGMKREEVLGKSLMDLYFSTPEQKESLYVKTYTKAMETREPASFVDYYAPLNIWTTVYVYPQAAGGLAVFFREISEEKKKEQDLRKAISSRDEFMSLASHELKTPLTSLKLQSQILKKLIEKNDSDLFPTQKVIGFSEQTEKQVARLSRLIDDMLDISRIKTGKLSIVKEEFNLCDVVRDVLERMEGQFQSNGYAVPVFHECPEARGKWDLLRLEQAIMNLLTNAIRYGEKNLVTLKVESQAETVKLSVTDQGIGIRTEDQEKVFQRFQRVSTIKDTSGLGLGLYLTSQIVEAHGGKILVKSKLGEGSTFTIVLPRDNEGV